MITRLGRLLSIERVIVKYGLEDVFLSGTKAEPLKHLFLLSPTRWLSTKTRALPRGERLRLALEELGPVFVKLGQMLSTRLDLLPEDIGAQLSLLQDKVPPFSNDAAREAIEKALGDSVHNIFETFEPSPMASASVAQVHGAVLKTGEKVVVKVLRPGIARIIDRDVALMYLLADLAAAVFPDGKRLRPREVVAEYDHTIHGELNLTQEASNAVVLRNNFKDSDKLYVPEIHWEYTRPTVLVMERIQGIPIRDVAAMHDINMDMQKLAEHGVEIFYTQVFKHNFFHADMHPGNIFVSDKTPEHPQYIAIDFGIVGSLTEDDQRYLGENLLAFFKSDYRRVAQLHVDSGWVPAHTRVGEFETAIRSVCEPIFEKPLAEISFGHVLLQLFQTARRFEMEVQPQMVLLQKTLLNIEGLGRQLYPDLDLWATGKPFLEQWVLDKRGPKAMAQKFIDQAPQIIEAMPHMPMLVHDYLKNQSVARAPMQHRETQQSMSRHKALLLSITGATLTLSSALIASVQLLVSNETQTVSIWVVVCAVAGLSCLLSALFK